MATRVNKNFLIILSAVLVGTTAVLFASSKLIFNKDTTSLITAGDAALATGDAQQAISLYKRAVSKQPSNLENLIKLGDAYNSIAGESNENLGLARGAWSSTLTINSAYLPALERLTDSLSDQLTFQQSPGLFQQVKEHAAKLAKAQADRQIDNKKALSRQHLAVVQPWLAGMQVSVKDADDSLEALKGLAPKDPTNADIAWTLAAAKLRRSAVTRQQGDEETANKLLTEGVASMDASLVGQEKNVDMQSRANRVYEAASNMMPDEKLKAEYLKKADAALDAAIAGAKPEDERYAEVIRASAARAARQKKPDEAAKILRDLLAKKPQDPNVRLSVAMELAKDPANRDEALGILSRPLKTSAADVVGAKAIFLRYFEATMHLEMGNLLVAKVRASDNDVARANALTELDKQFALAEAFYPSDNVPLLRLKARRLQLRGDNNAAIQTFVRAISLMSVGYNERDELMNETAMAYLSANQTSAAKKLLDEIAEKHEKHLPTRLTQFDIALRENNLEEAKKLLEIIEKLPEAATVAIPLRVQYLKKAGDPKAADAYYAKLPEQTRIQRLGKAQIAAQLEKMDDVIRLSSINYKADPKDFQSMNFLVRGLVTAKRVDEAKKVLDDAIKADPKNAGLADMRQRLDLDATAMTGKQRYEKEVELLKGREKDPFRQAMLLGELARRFGLVEDAAKHYADAAALNPKDAVVTSRRFDMALAQGKFDEAQSYLKPLIEAAGESAPIIQAKFALAKGDAPSALKYARELTKSRAEFADSWVLLGQAQQAMRQYNDAVNAYLQARERQAGNFDAVKGLVECYYTLNQPADAGHVIDQGRGLFPDNALFKEMELTFETNYGDPEKAIVDREQQYKENPTQAIRPLILADVYQKVALTKYVKDAAKRDAFMKKAADVLAKGAEAFPQDSRFQNSLAGLSLASGKFEEGEARLKAYAAQEAMKSKPEPMLMLADYYQRAQKPDKVEAALREAMTRSNKHPEVRARLVASLANQKEYKKALTELEGQTDRIFIQQRINLLVADGRGPEAEAEMKKAITGHPDESLAYRGMLIDYYVRNNRFPEAIAQIDPVLKEDPKSISALYSRAIIRLRQPQRDVNGAIDDLKRIRSIDPLNLDAGALLSDAYYASGLPDKSLAELEDIAAKAPGNPGIRRKLLERYMQRGDFDSALRLAKEAESSPATSGDAYWPLWVARASTALGNMPDAISAMQRAVKRTPESANLGVFREYLDTLIRGKQYKQLFDTADDVIKQGRKDWWALMDRGIARALGNKDVPGALADFDAALTEAEKDKDPNSAEQVVNAIQQTVGGKTALERVQARGNINPRRRVVIARLFELNKDHASAVREMDQAVQETTAKDTPPELRLAVLYAAAGFYYSPPTPQIDKAQATYEEIIRLVPKDFGSLNNLAVLLSEDASPPDIKRATEYSKRAYDIVKDAKPMNTHVVDTYAWLLVQNNQAKEAVRMLEDVVDQEPTLIDARYHLAEAHLQLKEAQPAQDQLKAALTALKGMSEDRQAQYAKMKSRMEIAMQKATAMLAAASSNPAEAAPR